MYDYTKEYHKYIERLIKILTNKKYDYFVIIKETNSIQIISEDMIISIYMDKYRDLNKLKIDSDDIRYLGDELKKIYAINKSHILVSCCEFEPNYQRNKLRYELVTSRLICEKIELFIDLRNEF